VRPGWRRALSGVAVVALSWVPPAVASPPLELGIVQPVPGQPVFGDVEVTVEVRSGAPVRLEFFLNERKVGELVRPPWRLVVPTGDENIDRRFRVVGHAADGSSRSVELAFKAIRVDDVVEAPLQQLYITATREGQPALDLARHLFTIEDDGKRQEVVTFERGDIPLTALLMIDSSLSMRGEPLRAALAGARAFAADMKPLDEAMLLLFSDRVLHRTPFTADPDRLVAGLTGAEAGGGTALNDHLFLSLELLERRQGRRAVILLSDGIDVESLLTAAQVLEVAGRTQTLVYWIRIANDPLDRLHRSPWRDVREHQRETNGLTEIVASSGGRVVEIPRIEEAAAAFGAILLEMRQQYVLGYYPKNPRHDGKWREIQVESTLPGVELRARGGYYDD